ncbi:5-methyltetrahydropteroyltriglutamate/homocystei neS-methyltransferase [Thermocrinis albus DSM 14484]|uniref:5-methyltetrahydropteroyltriglutamate--homocysteine methyltransferase n=1 Tax=Thermocrinis albus (strain DSM 14484 / JCM 11386 / HI 11/12) TaxID=638303 RepID=D3SMX3_THEAH|nr:5-methyltetrahydropteroyltriglutamate--homocysteine S-methyltransferase [Thermocrinis albus]ADC90103.1 5-methyltetrahydropteroyltriglutamate/homocystei neS-methyltransferase [Thermocrinis albus DSM 14484]
MRTLAYGFPKLGDRREFKSLLENFWKGKITEEDLTEGMNRLRDWMVDNYRQYVDLFPSNELSYYDFVLDTAVMVGAIPSRFGKYQGLSTYFEMARGKRALEMTKYFNTNYHYLVPELETPNFHLLKNFPLEDYNYFSQKGIDTLPRLLAPYTFLVLSKAPKRTDSSPFAVLQLAPIDSVDVLQQYASALIPLYREVLKSLASAGAKVVLMEDPALTKEMTDEEWRLVTEIYHQLAGILDIYVLTYYDSVSNYERFVQLPVKGLGLDLVSNVENLENIKKLGFPQDKVLIAGILNGRQVWRANIEQKARLVEDLSKECRELVISNSCPLFHLPISVEPEDQLPEGLKERLAFAREKLQELKLIKGLIEGDRQALEEASRISKILATDIGRRDHVRERVRSLKEEDFRRSVPYRERIKLQQDILNLPLLPTTTIGSFPQTEEVRKMRTAYRNGRITQEEYKAFIKKQIEHVIKVQEEIGLDVLVHGEFERTDMVEFFAEKLEGIATTKHGWVLSYGSRVYRPPIIYGDVERTHPMTLEEISYAQSLTSKPVKGMLTGPVTILNWSYYREDVPKHEIAYQIALALLDEVRDLEKAGIKVIQIDEPAFREGAPIKRRDWEKYFDWAIKAFRLCSNAQPQTQIHTHMCYSEFNEVIEYIYQMDFDVISIEASRSKGEIIAAFENFKGWDRQIGIGVYDIHSPAIPEKEEIKRILERAMKVIPVELLWVNPDCGLKTRNWEEVIPSLRNMVDAARELRTEKNPATT